MSTRLVLVVAAAIFRADGRVLMAQRPEGKSMAGLWEFPGGKVEKGEAPEAALCRELYEELQITVDPETLRPISFATFNYESFHLLMPLYEVTDWVGEPKALEGQSLDWVRIEDLKNYPAPPADIPLFEELARRY
ncbi:(deoxy)nucleoside triphosphate pyrophosphohydrolase [Henriciella litoralis]|uniref:(deoxy)nucleoside triphosphate pyrophosphohydrolase n=1 Tax=Henriciella litoralis TaxID=568102 RepID=UPI0009FD264A|nr:(deoxy)nucleoside triphosphate pyrophosphohydrolase [Henriciella litoralis]